MRNKFVHKVAIKQNKANDSYYCCIGDEEFIDTNNNPRINDENDKRVLAKSKIKDNGQTKFLIRLDINKKFMNPIIEEISVKSKSKSNNLFTTETSFKEVSGKVFDLYLNFLRTKNQTWIIQAEREDF